MKKCSAKRTSKTFTFQLDSSECWDTIKAQMLAKIDAAIEPRPLDFTLFDIKFIIPRIVSKPGIPLSSENDYLILLQHVCKPKNTPIVSIVIIQSQADGEKENLPAAEPGTGDKVKKKRDPATLPSNVKKNANIQLLQGAQRSS